MKYKDYYSILGVPRDADATAIKKAYRKLAHQYHPDVSKDATAEEKFKEISEAYQTLKDADKRAAYDNLGTQQAGQDFEPPPNWQNQYGGSRFSFDDLDLSDIFAQFSGGRQRRQGENIPVPGQDYEVTVNISLEDAYAGTTVDLNLSMPEYDEQGRLHRVPQTIKARIAPGATDGQRLRLRGKGGKGLNGGRDGDLYLNIVLEPHDLYRVNGHDLYIDLPLTPWESVLGATIEVPTLAGPVNLKVAPGAQAGQKLRLANRGLPKQFDGNGDLFAIVQVVVPRVITEQERSLYKTLAEVSAYNPRRHFKLEKTHAG